MVAKKYIIPTFRIYKTNYGKEWEAWNVNYVFRAPTREALDKKIEKYFEEQHQRNMKSDYTPAIESFKTGCCFFCKQSLATTKETQRG